MRLLPEGETGGALLLAALAAVGIDATWVVWDDDEVDWACDVVAVRSTWDYQRRPAQFAAWAHRVERISPLLNGAAAFAWNADKAYLLDLAPHLPVVPTTLVEETTLLDALRAGLAAHGTVVIKPRTGAGGVGVVLAEATDDPRLEGLVAGPWVLQPLVGSVRTTGETSVYVLGGEPVSQVDKRPTGAEVRVHELYGGSARAVPLAAATGELAERAVALTGELLGRRLDYARVDMMVVDGEWAISELELIEPGLYLDVEPANAERFAALVAAAVGR